MKLHTFKSICCMWSPHDSISQSFLGFFTSEVRHKTTPDIIPITFYTSEDSIRSYTLLSYLASVHLGIVKFKVPTKAESYTVIDAITNIGQEAKQVTCSIPLQSSKPVTKKSTRKQKLKSVLKSSTKPTADHPLPRL